MILDKTTDVLQILLDSAITTRQLNFYSSYGDISSTGLTPSKIFGSTNSTTPVTLMPTPNSGEQNQLKHCVIYNCDSVSNKVTIQISGSSYVRKLLSSTLLVGDYIQYTPTVGWQIYTYNGVLKNYGLAQNPSHIEALPHTSYVTLTTGGNYISGTNYACYLGTADRTYNQITVMYNVSVALGATISWAELAIYKGYPTIGSNTLTLIRCGYKDCNASTGQSGFAATGVKRSIINVTDIYPGDNIWAVISTSTTGTNLGLNYSTTRDHIGSGILRTVTGSLRPSLYSAMTFTVDSSATNPPHLLWQGFQR